MAFELELPAAYLDAIIEDTTVALTTGTPFLINQSPEPGEEGVERTAVVELDVTTAAAAGTITLAETRVYIEGILAFDGGVFQPGYGGAESSYSNPVPDVLRIAIDYTAPYDSEQVVDVRVVSKSSASLAPLDETYSFTITDETRPLFLTAEARELKRVRVTFNEPVKQTAAGNADSALRPGNWELERLGDGVTPLVAATVTLVESVDTATVDLLTDIPLTPGGTYRVYATGFGDVSGNVLEAPFNQVTFLGWQPPVPADRLFDLYRMLPLMNRQEDEASLDLKRFIGCLQEVTGLQLYDIDTFTDILDPDIAPEGYVDLMLCDQGNPFSFQLTDTDKRRLAGVLVAMYKLKGTAIGIEQVVLFFLGLTVAVDPFNGPNSGGLILGDSELGVDWTLGTDVSALLYSFRVISGVVLTAEQRTKITGIAEYMKPAHTHFVELVEPVVPVVLDHLELGLSELGVTWELH